MEPQLTDQQTKNLVFKTFISFKWQWLPYIQASKNVGNAAPIAEIIQNMQCADAKSQIK
jgi:hypothetical protein